MPSGTAHVQLINLRLHGQRGETPARSVAPPPCPSPSARRSLPARSGRRTCCHPLLHAVEHPNQLNGMKQDVRFTCTSTGVREPVRKKTRLLGSAPSVPAPAGLAGPSPGQRRCQDPRLRLGFEKFCSARFASLSSPMFGKSKVCPMYSPCENPAGILGFSPGKVHESIFRFGCHFYAEGSGVEREGGSFPPGSVALRPVRPRLDGASLAPRPTALLAVPPGRRRRRPSWPSSSFRSAPATSPTLLLFHHCFMRPAFLSCLLAA